MKNNGFQKDRRSHTVLTVVFTIIAIAYLYPIFIVLVNSLKSNAAINLDTFAFPTSGTFMGLQNYIKGMTFGNYPFYRSVEYSLMITLLSSALILICTSMAAWYISRVDSLICRVVYYLCVFSMVVPFQMVMFTLAKTADTGRGPSPSSTSASARALPCSCSRASSSPSRAPSRRPRSSTAATPCRPSSRSSCP